MRKSIKFILLFYAFLSEKIKKLKDQRATQFNGNTKDVKTILKLVSNDWEFNSDGLQRRIYSSYELYLKHQKSKLLNKKEKLKFSNYDEKFKNNLKARLENLDISLLGSRTLCLGARLGGEVRAFKELGSYAVGIDLEPGERNNDVLFGDFHEINFPDNSVDFIYTNSLDHVYDIDKVLNEIKRVLTSEGYFISEFMFGEDHYRNKYHRRKTLTWESFWWKNPQDIINLIKSFGFILFSSETITKSSEIVLFNNWSQAIFINKK